MDEKRVWRYAFRTGKFNIKYGVIRRDIWFIPIEDDGSINERKYLAQFKYPGDKTVVYLDKRDDAKAASIILKSTQDRIIYLENQINNLKERTEYLNSIIEKGDANYEGLWYDNNKYDPWSIIWYYIGILKELEDKCKSIIDKFVDDNSEYDMLNLLRKMFSYDVGNEPRHWYALFYLKRHTLNR